MGAEQKKISFWHRQNLIFLPFFLIFLIFGYFTFNFFEGEEKHLKIFLLNGFNIGFLINLLPFIRERFPPDKLRGKFENLALLALLVFWAFVTLVGSGFFAKAIFLYFGSGNKLGAFCFLLAIMLSFIFRIFMKDKSRFF